MNLKTDLELKEQSLLQEIGYKIENREYSTEEIKKCECFITDYIMSKSSKSNAISKETLRFNELINILSKNER